MYFFVHRIRYLDLDRTYMWFECTSHITMCVPNLILSSKNTLSVKSPSCNGGKEVRRLFSSFFSLFPTRALREGLLLVSKSASVIFCRMYIHSGILVTDLGTLALAGTTPIDNEGEYIHFPFIVMGPCRKIA